MKLAVDYRGGLSHLLWVNVCHRHSFIAHPHQWCYQMDRCWGHLRRTKTPQHLLDCTYYMLASKEQFTR